MNQETKQTFREIADAVIKKLLERAGDPFVTPTLVFHNTKAAQWFKAYYLKKQREVLMNVRFETLSVFVNGLINPKREFTILDRAGLREYILHALLDPNNGYRKGIDYIFRQDGTPDGNHLYEFADRLAELYLNYELDDEWGAADIPKWEKTLYAQATAAAAGNNCYTTGSLFAKQQPKRTETAPVYILDNAYVTPLFLRILDTTCDGSVTLYSLEKNQADNAAVEQAIADKQAGGNDRVLLVSAPSVLREVEALHSAVCKAVNEQGSALRYNDIVVYAPDITAYANTIRRVFEQDNKEYPAIPYRIVGESKELADMLHLLTLLREIAVKRYFTRQDFYDYVTNPMVQWIHGIEKEDVELWMHVIEATHAHRNAEAGNDRDDWNYLKERVLLSYFVPGVFTLENVVEVAGTKALPYTEMMLDEKQTAKMIEQIEALLAWNRLFTKDLNEIRVQDLTAGDAILHALDGLCSSVNAEGEEKNYLYRAVRETLERVTTLLPDAPAGTLLSLLADAPTRKTSSPADMFAGGVTFVKLQIDNILPSEMIFLMGMSSAQFPRVETRSELDCSQKHRTSEELDYLSVQRVLTGCETAVFSFVRSNLQTDEEFYPTAFLTKVKVTEIGLDEKRPYEELFTAREFKRKNYDTILGTGNTQDYSQVENSAKKVNQQRNLSSVKSYLKNTFIYKYNSLVRGTEDDEKEVAEEYEVLDPNGLDQYAMVKEMILGLYLSQDSDTDVKAIQEKMQLEQKVLQGDVGVKYLKSLYDDGAAPVIAEIQTGYEKASKDTFSISDGQTTWTVKNNLDVFVKDIGNELWVLEPIAYRMKKEKKAKDYLGAYVYSLLVLSRKPGSDLIYTVHLGIPQKEYCYTVTAGNASTVLLELLRRMSDLETIKYMEIDWISGHVPDEADSIQGLEQNCMGTNGGLNYFNDKKMVDALSDFGYPADANHDDFQDEATNLRKLILFLN